MLMYHQEFPKNQSTVSRIAYPWLIRRFVDKAAEFPYVPADQVLAVAECEVATPYDVPKAELGHYRGECSFDAIMKEHQLADQALLRLARIVRGADPSTHDLTPESLGLLAIAKGFRLSYQAVSAAKGG
jgi:hypothetical protein